MADSFTSNRNLVQPLVGGDSGTWGGILNSGVMGQLDLILGATQAITVTSLDVTLSTTQWNNLAFNVTGTLTGDHKLILPFNPNSTTVAVGGFFIVENNTTGAHNLSVLTSASGSVGVTAPQGVRSLLYSDATNVWNADDAKLQLIPFSGNPNGSVAGSAGSVNSVPSAVWDYTNAILYLCTVTGTASVAQWTNIVASASPQPEPQGYLTPVSGTAIITSDSIAATAVYYTPFVGGWAAVHNGLTIIPYKFTQFQLTLTSSQAANQIYDVYLAFNSGTPVIGTGPSWAAGSGGSVTAGSCARGTGAGGAAINRDSSSGLWVNTASMSLIWNTGSGNSTITVAAGQGIYLGSIFVDGTGGQVTCHRAYGQSRKWGIFNAYNRVPTYLKAGDGTASWSYGTATYRASDGSSANSLTLFSGLAEEIYDLSFLQNGYASSNSTNMKVGIGYNSTTAASGTAGGAFGAVNAPSVLLECTARYLAPPALGINVVTSLEQSPVASSVTFVGTEASMLLSAEWRV